MGVNINITKHERAYIDKDGKIRRTINGKAAPETNLEQSGIDTETTGEGKNDEGQKEVE